MLPKFREKGRYLPRSSAGPASGVRLGRSVTLDSLRAMLSDESMIAAQSTATEGDGTERSTARGAPAVGPVAAAIEWLFRFDAIACAKRDPSVLKGSPARRLRARARRDRSRERTISRGTRAESTARNEQASLRRGRILGAGCGLPCSAAGAKLRRDGGCAAVPREADLLRRSSRGAQASVRRGASIAESAELSAERQHAPIAK